MIQESILTTSVPYPLWDVLSPAGFSQIIPISLASSSPPEKNTKLSPKIELPNNNLSTQHIISTPSNEQQQYTENKTPQ
jgi:hypothetical protein